MPRVQQKSRRRRTAPGGFFCPGAAPALGRDLLAGEQGASCCRVGCLALVQRAVGAVLAGGVLWVFLGVGLAAVGPVAQGDGVGVGVLDHGCCRRLGQRQAAGSQRSAGGKGVDHKGTA